MQDGSAFLQRLARNLCDGKVECFELLWLTFMLNESARLVEVALGLHLRCRITTHSTGLAVSLLFIIQVDCSPVNSGVIRRALN